MPQFVMTSEEIKRLKALKDLGILDTPPDEEFDAIVRAVALACGKPIALISLVDESRQWFKANVGLEKISETARELAFCDFTIRQESIFEVPDASVDDRFKNNPLVTADSGIRFYAGMPLRLSGGEQVGSLCVISDKPGSLTDTQREILHNLGYATAKALESWGVRRLQQQMSNALQASEDHLRRQYESAPAMLQSIDPEGCISLVSDAWLTKFGYTREEVIGRKVTEFLHPSQRDRGFEIVMPAILGVISGDMIECRFVKKDGETIDTIISARPDYDALGNLLRSDVVIEDITLRTRAEESLKQWAEALHTNQQLLEQTGRVAGIGGWEVDLVNQSMHWTPETYRIIGLDELHTPVIGEIIARYVPDARPIIIEALERAKTAGEAFDLQLPFMRTDDTQIWVRVAGSALFENGVAVRLIGAFQDVTKQVTEQQKLQEATQRMTLAADSGEIGIWDWNIKTGNVVWDGWMNKLYGLETPNTSQDYDGWRASLHPDDVEVTEAALRNAVAGGKPYDLDYRVVWEDGSIHTLRAAGRVIRDENDVAVRMVGTNWDITRERALSAELAEQHELLRVTLRSIVDAVITTDATGHVTWMNPVAEKLTGWCAAEAVGRSMESIYRIVDAHTRAPKEILTLACLTHGRIIEHDTNTILLSRHGVEFGIEDSVAPIRNDRGDILGVVKVFRDVTRQHKLETERKEREQQLVVANAELDRLARHFAKARGLAEQASRAKTRFLAAMSHELRTPLNGILGYAQLLQMDGGLTDKQSERVRAMLSAGTHLLEMISFVLDLSEIETEGVELQAAPFDLGSLADASLDIVRPTAEAKNLNLSLVIADGIPSRVRTDPARLRQILLNLLGNAVKFTDSGSVALTISLAKAPVSTKGDMRISFEVRDTGPGISDSKKHLLFKEFERLSAAGAANTVGAGLGLALSRRLSELLGGDLTYADNPGGGSIFRLELPLIADDPEITPVRASDFLHVNATGVAPSSPARPTRVLVVDDVAMNRDIATAFIQSAGYQVVCASGGVEAVEIASKEEFDAVLMDVRMPIVDGLEATRRIRALPAPYGLVPIVALTAQVFSEQVEACRQAGMDTHVAKPFTLETLLGAIARGIAVGHARAAFDHEDVAYGIHTVAAPAPPPAPKTGTPPIGTDIPVLDETAFDRTAAMVKPEAVKTFLRGLSEKIGDLKTRLNSSDLPAKASDLAEAAHALAGSAGMFGFERLVFVARHFEDRVETEPTEATKLAQDLKTALDMSLITVEEKRLNFGKETV